MTEDVGLDLIVETELPFEERSLEVRTAWILEQLDCLGRGLTLVLVDDENIRDLNQQWRAVDEATDVLSFPLQEGFGVEFSGGMLGDIMISVETATRLVSSGDHTTRVARELGREGMATWSLLDEITFLFIHGLLHLLGYDHAEEVEEVEMRTKEAELMNGFLQHVALEP